ncbi:MAG: hypothetical protein LBH27_01185 [Endomicrobium sp.]|nr:hypothetical protein [Endomicrobium sp.]
MIKKMYRNSSIVAKTGNEIIAEAMRQIEPGVVAAYPITPATEIVQIFSQFVADGVVNSEYVAVESEHSAMSAAIAASAAGVRSMTSTSSQGLCLMWEMLFIASGLRLPVIMAEVSRAISAPININTDHSDVMGTRDSGWIQIYSENPQEAYDNMIQATKIAEESKLPALVAMDGFITSHCMEIVEVYPDSDVKAFVGEYKPERYLLDVKNPYTLGSIDLQDYYFEHRYQLAQAVKSAKKIILDVSKEFKMIFGREYNFYEKYMLDDAEIIMIIIGSAAGNVKSTVKELRKKGIKAGLLKIRVYRPFPAEQIVKDLMHVKVIAVMDRSDCCSGAFPPIYSDVTASLYSAGIFNIKILSYVYGIGGREFCDEQILKIYETLYSVVSNNEKPSNKIEYVNVRTN